MGENTFGVEDIEKLMDKFDSSNIGEFKFEQDGFKLELKKPKIHVVENQTSIATAIVQQPNEILSQTETMILPENSQMDGYVLKAPIIGTYYESSQPGSECFVTVGQQVKKGDVLCIIESMKLMNEITSEKDGIVSKVFVNNGDPLEYGQEIMLIKT